MLIGFAAKLWDDAKRPLVTDCLQPKAAFAGRPAGLQRERSVNALRRPVGPVRIPVNKALSKSSSDGPVPLLGPPLDDGAHARNV